MCNVNVMGSANQPLLGHHQEDQLWDRVEAAPPAGTCTTVEQVFKDGDVIKYLQFQGCQKVV